MRNPNIDYYVLLRKYMKHVRGCEGITFIEYDRDEGRVSFEDQEWDELEKLNLELWPDRNES